MGKLKQILSIFGDHCDAETKQNLLDLVDRASRSRVIGATTLYEADIVVGAKLNGLSKRLHFTKAAKDWADRTTEATKPKASPSAADCVFPFFLKYARGVAADGAAPKKSRKA
jgi:hypothetical protein